jgi:hypothetical protein
VPLPALHPQSVPQAPSGSCAHKVEPARGPAGGGADTKEIRSTPDARDAPELVDWTSVL